MYPIATELIGNNDGSVVFDMSSTVAVFVFVRLVLGRLQWVDIE